MMSLHKQAAVQAFVQLLTGICSQVSSTPLLFSFESYVFWSNVLFYLLRQLLEPLSLSKTYRIHSADFHILISWKASVCHQSIELTNINPIFSRFLNSRSAQSKRWVAWDSLSMKFLFWAKWACNTHKETNTLKLLPFDCVYARGILLPRLAPSRKDLAPFFLWFNRLRKLLFSWNGHSNC